MIKQLAKKYSVEYSNIAYIGDDENDYEAMTICGLKACPSNAFDSIKNLCDFISSYNGGRGAVREIIEYILDENRGGLI